MASTEDHPSPNLSYNPPEPTDDDDEKEVVYSLKDNKISYKKKGDSVKNGELVQEIDIPKFKRDVEIYLEGTSKDEATIFYAVVQIPSKVFLKRMNGHYKKLYVYSET